MRFVAPCRALSFVLVLIVAGSGALAGAQSAELEDALQEFVRGVGTFVDEVRFDQSDIDFFVASWAEVDALFGDETDAGDSMTEVVAELRSIMGMIQDVSNRAEYRGWAARNGVDADNWLRKALRIMMLSQQHGMLLQSGAIDIDAQVAQIEAQRDAYGAEAADASIEALRAMGAVSRAFERIGTPTQAEKSLLEDNWPQLVTAMDAGSDDADEWADDWGEEGGDDDAADIDIDLPDGALPFNPDATSYSAFFYGASYLWKGSPAATVELLLASSGRHCYLEDESIMAMDEGDTTIYTVYCLTHPGEVEEGDDILALTVMAAPVGLVGDLFARPERGWSAISVDRWIEEY